ncbi:LysM peptidoglycan-binding domain-containing protein [Gordonia effusa]|uniref:LysM peptidoglycan-binding domain-containing protein n=1 Tax=Gordonia effusa TaxID=263908 RepID=UPI001FE1C951|nr:LysM peptidoglycan-binding domain-containing protein [Gordonia effusa]
MKYTVQPGDTLWKIAGMHYGDARRYRAISAANKIADPDVIAAGQVLEIPDVTYRYQVKPGDAKAELAQRFYNDPTMSLVFEIPNGAAQRDLRPGEWLLIPDLKNPGHHTIVDGELLSVLAERWYGEASLWPIIARANHTGDVDPEPGTVIIAPGLNRRHRVLSGDTLWALVEHNYGAYGDSRTQQLVQIVAGANLIDDPDIINVGQLIYFPAF